ncbi:hypothetical protein [Microbacterium timonense]|uniref:hypothetical protein n=1 Tax=Microbacterium timonense TaxID=2086576 RepID=UPI000D11489A|nr:hypothetical protein [Microbacterium timonense]
MSRTTGAHGEVHERFRFVRATVVVASVAVALGVVAMLDPRSWYVLPLVATLAWLVWASWVWPRVVVGPDDVIVRNTFSTATIPYSDLDGVTSGLVLQFRTKSGARVRAFGVHAQTGLGRDAIRRSEAYTSGVVQVRRFDDLRPTASPTQASHVAENVQRRVATADPQPTHRRTRRRPNLAILVVTVVLLVVDAGALAGAYA